MMVKWKIGRKLPLLGIPILLCIFIVTTNQKILYRLRKISENSHNLIHPIEVSNEVQKTMLKRKNRIKLNCNSSKDMLNSPDLAEEKDWYDFLPRFIEDKANGLFYCIVRKAGSSTWANLILRLHGKSFRQEEGKASIHGELDSTIEHSNEIWGNKTYSLQKILTVRHPFSRLISFYRDKLASNVDKASIWKEVRSTIIEKHRDRTQKLHPKYEHYPTFIETVHYILNTPKEPMKYSEPHYRPISHWCYVCHHRYDYVIKMETFQRDIDYVLHQFDVKNKIKIIPKENKISNLRKDTLCRKSSVNKEDCLYKFYFSQLPPSYVEQLAEAYRQDFMIFGYNFTKTKLISLD